MLRNIRRSLATLYRPANLMLSGGRGQLSFNNTTTQSKSIPSLIISPRLYSTEKNGDDEEDNDKDKEYVDEDENVADELEEADADDDEAEQYSALDRLMRFKPALSREEYKVYNPHRSNSAADADDAEYEELEDEPLNLDGDPDPRLKLGKRLLSMGNIHYRHVDTLPEWFEERRDQICSYRTPSQIRRCLKTSMLKTDRDLLQKYRTKELKWGELLPMSGTSNKEGIVEYGPEETTAYAYYHMPSRFTISKRVFKEIKTLVPTLQPKRVIDFGCGPGTAAAAAFDVWGADIKYTGVDMSTSMLDAAKIMTKEMLPNCVFWDRISETVKRAEQKGDRYDMAVLTYTLSEMNNDPAKRAAVQLMFELLDVGGVLVIIEAGNPLGSHAVRTARQFVLDTFNNVDRKGVSTGARSTFYAKKGDEKASNNSSANDDSEDDEEKEDDDNASYQQMVSQALRGKDKVAELKRLKKLKKESIRMMLPCPPVDKSLGISRGYEDIGASVIAPCAHDRPCPMSSGVWCSFSQKVYSGLIRKASEEKFSYVVLQKRPRLNSRAAADAKEEEEETHQPRRQQQQQQHQHHHHNFKPKTVEETEKAEKINNTVNALPLYRWTNDMNSGNGTDPDGKYDASPLNVLTRFAAVEKNRKVLPGLVDDLLDEIDWNDYRPALFRNEWSRIVRSPIKAKGHITFDVCAPNGKMERTVLSKSNMLSIPSLFVALRKSSWGGLLPVLHKTMEHSPLGVHSKGLRKKAPVAVVAHDVVPEIVYQKDRRVSSRASATASAAAAAAPRGRISARGNGKDEYGDFDAGTDDEIEFDEEAEEDWKNSIFYTSEGSKGKKGSSGMTSSSSSSRKAGERIGRVSRSTGGSSSSRFGNARNGDRGGGGDDQEFIQVDAKTARKLEAFAKSDFKVSNLKPAALKGFSFGNNSSADGGDNSISSAGVGVGVGVGQGGRTAARGGRGARNQLLDAKLAKIRSNKRKSPPPSDE